jgi:hypothetical protein
MKNSVTMGLLCMPPGLAIGLYVAVNAQGKGYDLFPIFAGMAAFFTSFLFWWWLIEKRKETRKKFGILAGALSGFFAHFVTWYLYILAFYLDNTLSKIETSAVNPDLLGPLSGLWGAFVLSFWSLLFFGWLTIPYGAIIGGIFILKNQKKLN